MSIDWSINLDERYARDFIFLVLCGFIVIPGIILQFFVLLVIEWIGLHGGIADFLMVVPPALLLTFTLWWVAAMWYERAISMLVSGVLFVLYALFFDQLVHILWSV